MSVTYIPAALRRQVEERANYRCEYCLLPAGVAFFPHEIDHVIAEKHGGATNAENLAFTCWRCGIYVGRVATRASGSFNISTPNGLVQGISHKYCTHIHKKDGYAYAY